MFRFTVFLLLSSTSLLIQAIDVPPVFGNLNQEIKEGKYTHLKSNFSYSLKAFREGFTSSKDGITLDLGDSDFEGKLAYGFFPYVNLSTPIFFKKKLKIEDGKVFIPLNKLMEKRYDIVDYNKYKMGRLAYRVISKKGLIIYDGKINLKGKKFKIDDSLVEGPFLSQPSSSSMTISYTTNKKIKSKIKIELRYKSKNSFSKIIKSDKKTKSHELTLKGLEASTFYEYTVFYGKTKERYTFKTAPRLGDKKKIKFAFLSDSRASQGGGERDLLGVNVYVMKRASALIIQQKTDFLQFTGDMINGYSDTVEEMNFQFANWRRSIELMSVSIPIYVGMGNHECMLEYFNDENKKYTPLVKFKKGEQAEDVFASNFSMPLNGPDSEDGSRYDKDPAQINFPTYKENVYSYTYGNVAMINLNSNYWYSPRKKFIEKSGGNLHGYIMDNQLAWFKNELKKMQRNRNIDHIFVTFHTPFFPNGGHAKDDMWYLGDNRYRPYAFGKKVDQGIIERRDELLTIIDQSPKVLAVLTGDEHNYSRLLVGPKMKIYTDDYKGKRIKLKRKFWQFVNGAGGAPYYAQEKLPWSKFVKKFTVKNVLMFFTVNGRSVSLEVINPMTLEVIEKVKLL